MDESCNDTINDTLNKEIADAESFNEELSKALPILDEIWSRIGFIDDVKEERLERFYGRLIDTMNTVIAGEEDLEDSIKERVKENRAQMRALCFELALKHDDKFAKGLTMLDEEKTLRERVRILHTEKKKRLDEFKVLAVHEKAMCDRLKLKETELKTNVPTETEIEKLRQRNTDLETLINDRQVEMSRLKNRIHQLFQDLDMSNEDSFAEAIIGESEEDLPLSEGDIARAKQLLEKLRVKDEHLNERIRDLRAKIRSLWSKLAIGNEAIAEYVTWDDTTCPPPGITCMKCEVINVLDDELERCTKIKMANMQRFIEELRMEIVEFNSKMYLNGDAFGEHMRDVDYTEALLKMHEDHLEELRFKYDESDVLFEALAKWMNLWENFVAFEERTKDPNRFKTRGYNSLDEEKMRKQFTQQFPRLEDELVRYAADYEARNGGDRFMVHGLLWSDYLKTLRSDYEAFKANEKKEKQIIRDNAKQPGKFNMAKAAIAGGVSKLTTSSVKRKNDCTVMNAHGTPSFLRSSKLQRTELGDNTCSTVVTGNLTPAMKLLRRSKNFSRKSKTPLKNRLRNTRLNTAAAVSSNVSTMSKASSVPVKSALKLPVKASALPAPTSGKYKLPSSLKVQQAVSSAGNDTTLTGTTCSSNNKTSSTNASTMSKASHNSSSMPFKSIINNQELNYFEFTRDLKGFNFSASKSTAGASATGSHYYQTSSDIKAKLTSTIIHE